MSDVVTISGSPSASSRTAAVLGALAAELGRAGLASQAIEVRTLPPSDLVGGRAQDPATRAAIERIAAARAVVVGTPVYKAAFTGLLKAFLDLLPQDLLAGKVALPIAVGAAPAHALAVEQTLAPLLLALGADAVVRGLYLLDAQFTQGEADAAAAAALSAAALRLARFVGGRP
ncbi:MAG TPA: NADPH-dependent FMN reductase [Candidatus Acidoferrum sp.]|nr:NADPH-dependent FMN reductase [Candidatus Acidoferrum sp.]